MTFRTNHRIILITILIIGLFIILFLSLSSRTFKNDGTIYARSQQATLHPDQPVLQVFRAQENDLAEIHIPLKKFNAYPDERIRIELLDESCSGTIHSNEFGYFHFLFSESSDLRFEPIKDSKDKSYCLRVTYFAKEKRKGELPYLSASSDSIFADSSYMNMKDGRVYNSRSLAIQQAYSSGDALTDISTLTDRMSQYKPWFFKGRYLVSWGLISILGSILLATTLIFLKERD